MIITVAIIIILVTHTRWFKLVNSNFTGESGFTNCILGPEVSSMENLHDRMPFLTLAGESLTGSDLSLHVVSRHMVTWKLYCLLFVFLWATVCKMVRPMISDRCLSCL